jgi:arsenate reductase
VKSPAAVDKALLAILACPACRGGLKASSEAELECRACARRFPVRGGIPELIIEDSRMIRVVFVCVGNSCRSQMAEGFARALGEGRLEAHSAGSKPSGTVDATAVRLMKEKGIDISGQRSKGLSDLPEGPWDYAITMGCGDSYPRLEARRRLEWGVADPKGPPPAEFRKVRDELEKKIRALVAGLPAGRP